MGSVPTRGRRLATLRPASTTPNTSIALLDSHTLAIGTGDRIHPSPGIFELFDLQSERHLEPTFREPNGVRTVAACPTKQLVAWATGHKENSKRELKVWDRAPPDAAAFHTSVHLLGDRLAPDGSAFAAAEEWTVFVYDLSLKQERAVLQGAQRGRFVGGLQPGWFDDRHGKLGQDCETVGCSVRVKRTGVVPVADRQTLLADLRFGWPPPRRRRRHRPCRRLGCGLMKRPRLH